MCATNSLQIFSEWNQLRNRERFSRFKYWDFRKFSNVKGQNRLLENICYSQYNSKRVHRTTAQITVWEVARKDYFSWENCPKEIKRKEEVKKSIPEVILRHACVEGSHFTGNLWWSFAHVWKQQIFMSRGQRLLGTPSRTSLEIQRGRKRESQHAHKNSAKVGWIPNVWCTRSCGDGRSHTKAHANPESRVSWSWWAEVIGSMGKCRAASDEWAEDALEARNFFQNCYKSYIEARYLKDIPQCHQETTREPYWVFIGRRCRRRDIT